MRLDDLQLDGLKLWQYEKGYNFTSDSVILANFVKTGHRDVAVEIGSGSGIISILVNYKNSPKKIYAFEIQQKYADLTQKNVNFNKMSDKITVICDDVVNFKKYLDFEVDVVFCNPPYFKEGTSKPSESEERAISRHEKYLPLSVLVKTASKMLKFGGYFYCMYPCDRISEIVVELKNAGMEIKKMFFSQPNSQKNANLVYICAKKGAKGGTVVLPTLVTNNLDGDYVMTIQKLYKNGG